MKSLLLTHGYFLSEDPKEQQIMRPYPPLGLLYLSSHLRAQGFACDLYDSTFGERAELHAILETGKPGVLGIYGNLLTRSSVLALAQHARAAGWLVVLGGPEPSNYATEYLAAGADLIVSGEGELALQQLCVTSFAREAWPKIPGLFYLGDDGTVHNTGPAQTVTDLDAQPWPDRERIDIPRYLRAWREHHGRGSVSVITARGCPYHCDWCSHSVFGKTHRRRSAPNVADEVEYLLGRYGPDMLWMADDVFTIHHGWLKNYAAELRQRGIRIPFECITRADRLNEAAADLLGELNCERVWIGSESGSQRLLDSMRRGVTTDQVYSAIELCRARGIQTGMFLMWGYAGEDLDDIEATISHVKRCRPDIFFTTVSYPIKGTPYFDKVSDQLVRLQPWSSSTERDVKIRGRHSRNFYRHADNLLRSETEPIPDPAKVSAARAAMLGAAHEAEA